MRPCLGLWCSCAPHLALCHVDSFAEITHETPRLRRNQVHAIGGHCDHGACELAVHVLSRADPQLDDSVRCLDGGPVTELWQRISSPMAARVLTVTGGGQTRFTSGTECLASNQVRMQRPVSVWDGRTS